LARRSIRQRPVEADRKVVAGGVRGGRGARGTAAQVALAWVLGKGAVTSPIIGATKMQHLEDAVAALEVKLSDEESGALQSPYVPHAVVGFS
jgi:aryl-alcohol dehydrogenase-like predicted oxidoreductase